MRRERSHSFWSLPSSFFNLPSVIYVFVHASLPSLGARIFFRFEKQQQMEQHLSKLFSNEIAREGDEKIDNGIDNVSAVATFAKLS